jgi:hypothetical protein
MRFAAVEANATKRPVSEIAAWMLAPSAGVVPSGVEARMVDGTQVLVGVLSDVMQVERQNISEAPLGFGAVGPRFVAEDAKATKSPASAMAGFELARLPGVVPSGVETRYVVGVHPAVGATGGTTLQVLRIYT